MLIIGPGLVASLAALIVWSVQAFRSSTPLMALGMGFFFLVALFLVAGKRSRRSTLLGAGLALAGLGYAGGWAPDLLGPIAVGLMGVSVAIWLYPCWSRPLLAHLAEALAAAGFAHGERFLARGQCMLLLDALDEVVDPGARRRGLPVRSPRRSTG